MKRIKQVLAIDIGSAALKMAVLEVSGAKVRLLRTYLKEFPESASQRHPASSQKKDEFVKSSIQEFLTEGLSPKEVYIALSSPNVEIERIDIPNMPLQEIPEAVKWKIKDRISFKVDEAVVDSYIAEEHKEEDGSKKLAVTVAVVQKNEIYDIISIIKELHLTVVSINAVPFGIANILKGVKDIKPKEPVACVEIGAKHTYVSVYKSNRLLFTRIIPVSSSQITEAMCGVLVSDKGRMELSYAEAESIKKRFGLPVDQIDMIDGKIPPVQVVGMIRPILEQLAIEIKRTFMYYTSELKGTEPKKVYITGGGGKLKNLCKFLNEELNIDVDYLNLPLNIDNETKEDKESLLSFLGLISIAMPVSDETINLLPPELRAEKAQAIQKVSIRVVGFTVLCILILLYIGISMHGSSYKKRLDNALPYSKALQTVTNMYNKVSQYTEAVGLIKSGEISGELLFKEISNIVPNDIELYELEFNLDPKEVRFKGVIHQKTSIVEDELTEFMEDIEASAFFHDANLSTIEKKQEKGKESAEFEIICSLR